MRRVGKRISTKAVGRLSREDITHHYKYAEGTMAERAALGGGEEEKGDVTFAVEFDRQASIGEDFAVVVKASTTSTEKRFVRIRLTVHSVSYTGVARREVMKKSCPFSLKRGIIFIVCIQILCPLLPYLCLIFTVVMVYIWHVE